MGFKTRRSEAQRGKHGAKKSKHEHDEPSSTSPSEVVDMDVEHGEPMRTTVPIPPDPALSADAVPPPPASADAMPAPRHRATGIDASDGWT